MEDVRKSDQTTDFRDSQADIHSAASESNVREAWPSPDPTETRRRHWLIPRPGGRFTSITLPLPGENHKASSTNREGVQH